jgi:hypothetical protein
MLSRLRTVSAMAIVASICFGFTYAGAGLALRRPHILRLNTTTASELSADYSVDLLHPQLPPIDPGIVAAAADDNGPVATATQIGGATQTPQPEATNVSQLPPTAAASPSSTDAPGPTATSTPEPESTSTPGPEPTPTCVLSAIAPALCGRDTSTATPTAKPRPTATPTKEPTATPTPTPTPTPKICLLPNILPICLR